MQRHVLTARVRKCHLGQTPQENHRRCVGPLVQCLFIITESESRCLACTSVPGYYPGRDLNPHAPIGTPDFKSGASTNSATGASFFCFQVVWEVLCLKSSVWGVSRIGDFVSSVETGTVRICRQNPLEVSGIVFTSARREADLIHVGGTV